MTPRVGRTVRLSALALATGTIVVAASTGAHAAPTASTAVSYAGNAGSSVVALELNLPAGATLASALGSIPTVGGIVASDGSISLSLLNQTGSLEHDASGKVADLATSSSTFAGGSLGTVLTNLSQPASGLVLNQTITSTLANPSATSSPALGAVTSNLPSTVSGLLGLQVPGLKVTSAGAPLGTAGNSVLAGVNLGKIADALPAGTLDALTSALNSAADQATALAGSTTTTAGSTVGGLIGTITAPLAGTPLASLGTALTADQADLTKTLTELESELPAILTNIENGSILSINGLTTTHSVTTVGGEQVSTVSNKVAGISILGGLVTVDGFANALTTQAGGTAGTSKVIAQPNLAKVSLGTNDELAVILGQVSSVEGTVADLLNNNLSLLPADQVSSLTAAANTLTSGLGTLTTALNSALGAAGVSVTEDAVTQNAVASDGTSAKGALSGLHIVVDPLSKLPTGSLPLAQKGDSVAVPAAAAAPLLNVSVGALDASSAAGVVTAPTTPTVPSVPVKKLAFTGADLPLTAGVASLLVLGGAYAVRRRRSAAHAEDI